METRGAPTAHPVVGVQHRAVSRIGAAKSGRTAALTRRASQHGSFPVAPDRLAGRNDPGSDEPGGCAHADLPAATRRCTSSGRASAAERRDTRDHDRTAPSR